MEWKEFCEKTTEILRPLRKYISTNFTVDEFNFEIGSISYSYTFAEYNTLRENSEAFTFNPYYIANNKQYESIVDHMDFESGRRFSMEFEDKLLNLEVKNIEDDTTYTLQPISNELLWHFIKNINTSKIAFYRVALFSFERKWSETIEKDLLNLIRISLRLPYVISIKSKTTRNIEVFQQHAKAFLFNLAYNFNIVFKEISDIDELFPKRIVFSKRRAHSVFELDAPHLSYKQELVGQYCMAMSSEDPFVKFIAFYHIMEHFYEEVYNEDVFQNIQQLIQHPGFSAKRTKDIAKLVDLIKKKTRQNKEEFKGSELEALELTLKKYVNLTELINDLNDFDVSIVDYYKNNEVSFSKGDTIDLRDYTNEKIYKKLAARIYKTRNSLVHSKSNESRTNERGTYNPFTNKKELTKEIPLLKYISEYIIINSANTI